MQGTSNAAVDSSRTPAGEKPLPMPLPPARPSPQQSGERQPITRHTGACTRVCCDSRGKRCKARQLNGGNSNVSMERRGKGEQEEKEGGKRHMLGKEIKQHVKGYEREETFSASPFALTRHARDN